MYSGIIPIMKQAAIDAVNSTQPVTILFGQVISEDDEPLKIQVNPKLILEDKYDHLIVPELLTKRKIKVEVKGNTDSTEGHSHPVNGTFEITIDNKLKKEDYVILLRLVGGNKYLILDKAVK